MSRRPAKRVFVEPDYWTCPHGIRVRPEPGLTYGPEVADFNDKIGFTPDPQQELGLDLIFAIHPDGSPRTFSFCVICARQNLKSGLFLQAVIGWLFVLDDVAEVVWSAHLLATSLGAQAELERILTGSPLVSRYLMPGPTFGKYTANGQERFELNTGQKVWFQTRTINGGRGLGKPKVILDEAFKLKARIVGALLPILLAQHFPQLLYGSSAPPLDDDAAQLRDVMDRGRNHKSRELSYLEWLATREPCRTRPGPRGEINPDCLHPKDAVAQGLDCALDREHLIRQANPTLTTGRITLGTIRNLRQELPPPEYMRECMGWSETEDDQQPPAMDITRWNAARNDKAPQQTRAVVVVDVEPDKSAATIGLVGNGPGGRPLVTYTTRPGTSWVAKSLKKIQESCELLEVSLHPSGQAAILRPAIKKAGFEIYKLVSTDLASGCSGFITAVQDGQVTHVGQTELGAAVGLARTRTVGEAIFWDRANAPVPLGSLVTTSVALQRWLEQAAKPKTPPPTPLKVSDKAVPRRAGNLATVGF
ncbi:MAG TPA: hypothetical protein VFE15_15505 [Marmoricola sp.]|nr:hypothetical protein [Marmoricola sp.]